MKREEENKNNNWVSELAINLSCQYIWYVYAAVAVSVAGSLLLQ